MIDWWMVFSNAIWISGAALALATISYANWQVGVLHSRLREVIRQASIQAAFNVAGALFCLGMAATARSPLEIAIWLALTGLFVYQWLRDHRTAH